MENTPLVVSFDKKQFKKNRDFGVIFGGHSGRTVIGFRSTNTTAEEGGLCVGDLILSVSFITFIKKYSYKS